MGFGAFGELPVLGHENYEHVILIVHRVMICALLTPYLVLIRPDSSVLKYFAIDHGVILCTLGIVQTAAPGVTFF